MSTLLSHVNLYKATYNEWYVDIIKKYDKEVHDDEVASYFDQACRAVFAKYGQALTNGQTLLSLGKILSNLSKRTVFISKENRPKKSMSAFYDLIKQYIQVNPDLPFQLEELVKPPVLNEEYSNLAVNLVKLPLGSIVSVCAGPGTGKTRFIVDFLRLCSKSFKDDSTQFLLTGYARSTVNTIKHRMSATPELSRSFTDNFKATTKPIKIMSIDSMIAKLIPKNLMDRTFDQKIVTAIGGMTKNNWMCKPLRDNNIRFIFVDEVQSVDDLRMNFLLRMHYKYQDSVMILIGDPKQNVNGSRCTVSKQAFTGSLADNHYLKQVGYEPDRLRITPVYISKTYRFKASWSIKLANYATRHFFDEQKALVMSSSISSVETLHKKILYDRFRFNTVYDLQDFPTVIDMCINLTKMGISVGLMFPSVTKDQLYTKELLALINQSHKAGVCISFKNDTQFRVAGMNISTYASAPGTEFDVAYAVCPESCFSKEQAFVAMTRGRFFTHLVVNKKPKFLEGITTWVDRETSKIDKVADPIFYGRTIRPISRDILYDKDEFTIFKIQRIFFANNFHPEGSDQLSLPDKISPWRFNTFLSKGKYTMTQEEYVTRTGQADTSVENDSLYSKIIEQFGDLEFVGDRVIETSMHKFICPPHFIQNNKILVAYHDTLVALVAVLASHPELQDMKVYVFTDAKIHPFTISSEKLANFKDLFATYCLVDYTVSLYPTNRSKRRDTFVLGCDSHTSRMYDVTYDNVVFVNYNDLHDVYITDTNKDAGVAAVQDDMYDDEDVMGMTDLAEDPVVVSDTQNTIAQFVNIVRESQTAAEPVLNYYLNCERKRKHFAAVIPGNCGVNPQGIDIWPAIVEKALSDGYNISSGRDTINVSELYTQVISPRVSENSPIVTAIMIAQLARRYRITY